MEDGGVATKNCHLPTSNVHATTWVLAVPWSFFAFMLAWVDVAASRRNKTCSYRVLVQMLRATDTDTTSHTRI